jgi:hypothetical protein
MQIAKDDEQHRIIVAQEKKQTPGCVNKAILKTIHNTT